MDPAGTPPATSAHPEPRPTQQRIPFLDVARGFAMIGVVISNALTVVMSTEFANNDNTTASLAIEAFVGILVGGVNRTLLAMLLGIGLVLTWQAAGRRGQSPGWLLVRRYVALFLVFGIAHFSVFEHDVLAPYSLVALVVVPLLPWLLSGARWRPLVVGALGIPLSALSHLFVYWSIEVPLHLDAQGAVALMGFAVGIWLARLLDLAGASTEQAHTGTVGRRALQLAGVGLAAILVGIALMSSDALFGIDRVINEVSLPQAAAQGVLGSGQLVQQTGQALLYFALIYWLVARGGAACRALGVLAPLGQLSLTVYLGSTAVFLPLMAPFDEEISTVAQFGIGIGYIVVMALLSPLWLGPFRYGPAEWLWRCLTYLRPLPLLRSAPGK